jgi:hypothetical protein
VERVVVIARLKAGSRDAAAELLRAGPPYQPEEVGLVHHAVYLGPSEVVFLFEGPDVEQRLRALVNDPSASGFAAWAPLLEGTPVVAHEQFSWSAEATS